MIIFALMSVAPPDSDGSVCVYSHPHYLYINIIILLYISLFIYFVKTFRILCSDRFTFTRSEEIPLVARG